MLPTLVSARRRALPRVAARTLIAVTTILGATAATAASPAGAAPISLLRQINATTADASPTGTAVLNGKAYFFARTSGSPSEQTADLYVTDGTAGGTTRVAALPHPDTSSEQPSTLAVAGGRLYFSHVSTATGPAELWVSDGTTAGTHAVAWHQDKGTDTASPLVVAGAGNAVYLVASAAADAPAVHQSLYRLDATDTTATAKLLASAANGAIQTVTPVGTGAFFTKVFPGDPDDPTSGTSELWHTTGVDDTTASATELPVDPAPSVIVAAGSKAYFVQRTDTPVLWTSDGTVTGTTAFASGNGGTDGPTPDGFGLAATGSTAYFTATDGELWRWTGSGTPTKVTAPIGGASSDIELLGTTSGGVFYRRNFSRLYVTSGTGNGTKLLDDFGANWGNPAVTTIGTTTLFSASSAEAGIELWSTTGTATSTHRVVDLNTTPNNAGISQTVTMGGHAYFSATDGAIVAGSSAPSLELWRTDGTGGGTSLVAHLDTGADQTSLTRTVATPHAVAIFTSAGLWWSDGTEGGTHAVHPTSGADDGFFAQDPEAFGDLVAFTGPGATSHFALWLTDGTDAGTRRVVDLPARAGEEEDYEPFYTAAGAQLYFAGFDAAHGYELWHSDGTAAGTGLVRDLATGAKDETLGASTAVGDHLVFAAPDAAGIIRVWATNAAGTGATLLSNTAYPSLPTSIVANGDSVYVTVANQLYRVDGKANVCPMVQTPQPITSTVRFGTGVAFVDLSGTLAVSDGVGGASTVLHQFGGGGFGSLLPTASGLWFAEKDTLTATGAELWHSDGSAAGTTLVGDLRAGPASSTPTELAVAGSSLVFSADDGVHGAQLMATPLGDPLVFPAIAAPPCVTPDPGPTPTPAPQVAPTPTPAPAPAPTPVAKVTPRALSAKVAKATDRTAPYLYTFSGTVTLPAGAAAKSVCTGLVRIEIKRSKKVVSEKAVPLSLQGSTCGYAVSLRIAKKVKLPKQGKLVASVTFEGSAELAAVKAKAITLRYGH